MTAFRYPLSLPSQGKLRFFISFLFQHFPTLDALAFLFVPASFPIKRTLLAKFPFYPFNGVRFASSMVQLLLSIVDAGRVLLPLFPPLCDPSSYRLFFFFKLSSRSSWGRPASFVLINIRIFPTLPLRQSSRHSLPIVFLLLDWYPRLPLVMSSFFSPLFPLFPVVCFCYVRRHAPFLWSKTPFPVFFPFMTNAISGRFEPPVVFVPPPSSVDFPSRKPLLTFCLRKLSPAA